MLAVGILVCAGALGVAVHAVRAGKGVHIVAGSTAVAALAMLVALVALSPAHDDTVRTVLRDKYGVSVDPAVALPSGPYSSRADVKVTDATGGTRLCIVTTGWDVTDVTLLCSSV